jgi:hypothetical protein
MLPKQDIIDFIKRYDKTFEIKENIYYAAKAFKTNSVINYLGEMKDEDNLHYDEAEQVFNLLIKYLKGEADVLWDEGKVFFKLLKGGEKDEQQDSEEEEG